jgi:hypothetical protein
MSSFITADKIQPIKLVESQPCENPFADAVKNITDKIAILETYVFEFSRGCVVSEDLKPVYWMQDATEDLKLLKGQITRLEELIQTQCDEALTLCIDQGLMTDGVFKIQARSTKRSNRSVDKGIFQTLYPTELEDLITARIVDIKTSYKPSIKETQAILGNARANRVIIQGREIAQGYEVKPL